MRAIKTDQKEKERYYLEEFRKSYDQFPAGEIKNDDGQERPGVIIFGPEKIGLELTNLYHRGGKHDSESEQSLKRSGVVREAQRLYRENGGTNIELSFGFRHITNNRRKELPAELAELAKRIEDKI